jgi:hypothetical protein
MIQQSGLRIGDWWAPCCVRDLEKITTDAELEIAREAIPYAGGWTSLGAALRDLLAPHRYSSEVDQRNDVAYAEATWPDYVPF